MATETIDPSFEEIDQTTPKRIENNEKPESQKDDEFDTPEDLYYPLIDQVRSFLGIDPPNLDCFARVDNSKCVDCITKEMDAFTIDWLLPNGKLPRGWWINGPHTLHHEILERLHNQFRKFHLPAIMIMPARTRRTHYWDWYVERFRIGGFPKYKSEQKFIHNWPIHKSAIRFEKYGKKIVDKNGKVAHAGNSYEVLVFDPRLVSDWNYTIEKKTVDKSDINE